MWASNVWTMLRNNFYCNLLVIWDNLFKNWLMRHKLPVFSRQITKRPIFLTPTFFETFQTCFPDCFLHRPSQVSFHTMSEIFLHWRVTLMGKKAQNMSHPHKRISQNMPGQISKEEGESGNYIFFELEDRIRIAMGIIFGLEGGGEEWQSGSQRANVHSYSAHNETCPSSKIAFDVRWSPGLKRWKTSSALPH